MIINCLTNNTNNNNITCFTDNDMVYNKDKNGNIYSNGFLINSLLLNNNLPLFNCNKDDIFFKNHNINDLAIPTGLYFMSNNNNTFNKSNLDEINIVDDTLFSKLLDLHSYNSKNNNHNKTKKKHFKKKSKSRKNKI